MNRRPPVASVGGSQSEVWGGRLIVNWTAAVRVEAYFDFRRRLNGQKLRRLFISVSGEFSDVECAFYRPTRTHRGGTVNRYNSLTPPRPEKWSTLGSTINP